jgi:hypothetical protein
MKYSIKEGKHHASPLFFGLRFGSNPNIKRTVTFGFDTPYNLDGDPATMEGDDFDCNKLFGFGFLNFNKFPPHHYESIRVGWVWNSETHKVDLYAYMYIRGKRFFELIQSVNLGMPIEIWISSSPTSYYIQTYDKYNYKKQTTSNTYDRGLKSPIVYLLGPFFGGNRASPHDIDIFIIS